MNIQDNNDNLMEPSARRGFSLRRLLIGDPLSTSQMIHERLTNFKALAVFASDALSSTAYATEEMMLILILAGSSAAHFAWPLAIAIAVLLAIVASSYSQTVHAYPKGGGSYIVSHDNLGQLPGLTAAASILTDYVLTVSVSISAGVAALTSMIPWFYPYRVLLGLTFIGLIMILNLRGADFYLTVGTALVSQRIICHNTKGINDAKETKMVSLCTDYNRDCGGRFARIYCKPWPTCLRIPGL